MRIEDGRESSNVEDRRSGGGSFAGIGRGKIGIGTVVLALVAMYFGVDPSFLLQGGSQAPTGQSVPAGKPPAGDQEARFVSQVLADTEDTWRDLFKRNGRQYQDPKLVLFTGSTPTACGTGQSAMGPFLEQGDLESALGAAAAIGDDRIQKQTQGYAVPESFTHGSSEQRIRWFRRGFASGDLRQCDTFAGPV